MCIRDSYMACHASSRCLAQPARCEGHSVESFRMLNRVYILRMCDDPVVFSCRSGSTPSDGWQDHAPCFSAWQMSLQMLAMTTGIPGSNPGPRKRRRLPVLVVGSSRSSRDQMSARTTWSITPMSLVRTQLSPRRGSSVVERGMSLRRLVDQGIPFGLSLIHI